MNYPQANKFITADFGKLAAIVVDGRKISPEDIRAHSFYEIQSGNIHFYFRDIANGAAPVLTNERDSDITLSQNTTAALTITEGNVKLGF